MNIITFILLTVIFSNSCFSQNDETIPSVGELVNKDVGKALFLTPLIEAGKIQVAQQAAKVTPLVDNIASYSGFLTVNKQFNSNMFFWFVSAKNNSDTAPVIVWLQGGPGATSLFGFLLENGPFYVDNHSLKRRKYAWTDNHSVIYLDSPVGAGFSFTGNKCGYSITENQVGSNIYLALLQFFQLFPQFRKNDLFIAGESYAGKFVPAACYTIHKNNPTAAFKLNLKGMLLGNAFTDPENMMFYGDLLYQVGLLDNQGRDQFHEVEQQVRSHIKDKNWKDAYLKFDYLMNGQVTKPSLFEQLTGFTYNYNYLLSKNDKLFGEIEPFLSSVRTRKNIHVGNTTFNILNPIVTKYLINDLLQSVKPWIEVLLENYRVLFYNGQLDIIVGAAITEEALDKLNWSGANDFKSAPRQLWYVEGELAGYVTVSHNLTLVMVRNSGHTVPTDQPQSALDMVTKFTRNLPF